MMAFLLLIGNLLYFVSVKSTSRDCRLPGYLYRGTSNVTKSGLVCQRWDTQSPHEHNYFVFSLAQENYCRNFDREEPWCFTSNSSVRWELCAVDICSSPCLNQSFYNPQITSQCLSAKPPREQFCSWMWNTVECLKYLIDIYLDYPCFGIGAKSIALQNQNTIEKLIGESISRCFISPCTGLSNQEIMKYVRACYIQYPFDGKSVEKQCPSFVRTANCMVSKIGDETNETCLTKDKVSSARKYFIPQRLAKLSLCIPQMSEFPVPASEEELPNGEQNLKANANQTPIFVGIGFAVVLIVVGILIVSLITMSFDKQNEREKQLDWHRTLDQPMKKKMLLKKRRKELLRLPSVPMAQSNPYEANFTSPVDTYIDPDYEMIEEQDEGYQNLGEQRGGSYVDPNNANGTYLDVVPTSKELSDASYMNISPYIELIEDSVESNSRTDVNDKVQEPEENTDSSNNLTSN